MLKDLVDSIVFLVRGSISLLSEILRSLSVLIFSSSLLELLIQELLIDATEEEFLGLPKILFLKLI